MTLKVALAGAGAFGVKHLEGIRNIDGVEVVGDRFTLTNFGDLATSVTLERGGDFFTIEPVVSTRP